MPEHSTLRARAGVLVPPVALAAALLVGVLLRAAAGVGLLSSNLVYSTPVLQAAPGAGTPADAVRSFYLLLDQGDYAAAWRLSREPNYTGSGNAPYRCAVTGGDAAPRGWTPREAFVRRLTDELGRGGVWLRLAEVQAEEVTGAQAAELPAAEAAEAAEAAGAAEEAEAAQAAAAAASASGLKAAAVVRAQGKLLGACTIFHWEKLLPVAREGSGWRVLLPGTKQANSLFYQEWFANVRKVGALRAAGP
jgi:hypothetical protein